MSMFLPEGEGQSQQQGASSITPGNPETTAEDIALMQRVLSAASRNPNLIPSDFMAYVVDFILTSGLPISYGQIFGFPAANSARLGISAPPQSIANAVNAAVTLLQAYTWNTNPSLFAARGGTASGMFVAAGGIFDVVAFAAYASNATGDRYTTVRVNGVATDLITDIRKAAGGLVTEVTIGDALVLNAGDFVELYVFQSSGGLLNLVDAHVTMSKQ